MRYTGPRNRLARREGLDLGLKTPGSKSHAALLKKMNVRPGQHGIKSRRKVSEYGKQVREKQKLRYMFGVTEKQLKNYFQKSVRKTGNTGEYLSQYLERRLDNVVYRLGFTPTRSSARQLISHRNIIVNDRVLSIPSYQVRVNDVISFADDRSSHIPYIETSLGKKDTIVPDWLKKEGVSGKLSADPTADIIAKQINLRLVIEFYSR
ncbi:30S ribosomal protein S4 [Candidatus Roizmanbacteria bacterium]|nr:30S ribosomal protein S4 [Candidatus Roizmanbacteria bacterium]